MFMDKVNLQKAIDLLGSQAALARAIGKKQAHIWWWLRRAKALPPAQAIAIELATGGVVQRSDLCPEIFCIKKDSV